MNYLIGLDIGTSSVKGVLMGEDGSVQKTAHKSFTYTKTAEGGVEIDAEMFVQVCFSAIRELAQVSEGSVKALCASSASGNLVVLDKENRPVTPIFNWQDERVTTEAKEVLGEMDLEAFYRKVGCPFGYKTFPLALLCYVKVHMPEKLKNCGMVCMSTEYLYYRLTGKWGISTSAGMPFFLIDQETGTYIPEVLEKLSITEDKLPPIMECGESLGGITEKAAVEVFLPAETQVVLGSFDHPSAARGVGVLKEGEMLLSCGTSWVGFLPVNDRNKAVEAGLLIDPFLAPKGGAWATMVSVPSISERIQKYVHRYIDASDKAYSILSGLAEKSSSGAGGLHLSLYDEPNDNIIKGYSKEDIARAIMEGTVKLLKEKLEDLKSLGISMKSAVMVGGPSADAMWHKLIEEICGVKVSVLHGAHAGAVGAAILAGIGAGIYEDEYALFSEKKGE